MPDPTQSLPILSPADIDCAPATRRGKSGGALYTMLLLVLKGVRNLFSVIET